MDVVFSALSNADRRRMLDLARTSPGMNVAALSSHFSMSPVGVLKHVKLLEQAGLLVSEKRGRERNLYFNATPIRMIHDRWTNDYAGLWDRRAADR